MSAKRSQPPDKSPDQSSVTLENNTEFDEANVRRDHSGQFVPGSLASPANKDRLLFRKHAKEAVQTLLAVMRQKKSHTARVSAARELLDRGYGRPPQGVELSNKQGEVFRTEQQARIAQLSDAELDQQIAVLAEKAARSVDVDRAEQEAAGDGDPSTLLEH